MERLTEKFGNELSIACMGELSVDVDAESFYKFNWRLYLDDEFRMSFYENPEKALEVAGLNNITLTNTDLKNVEPLTHEEYCILSRLNNLSITSLCEDELEPTSVVQITGVKPAINIMFFGASADMAALVPEILRKKE
ncbi:MAG: hypothetical protein FWG55_02055 [Candidatus Bathyarchaeota archaeon]|nr:hypothetical protein [Candidatus Termiticorpusculum sp.]